MIRIRELCEADHERGLVESLGSLAPVGDKPSPRLRTRVMCRAADGHYPVARVFVAEADGGVVVGTATLVVLPKIIRGGRPVGQVEDVAVREGWRGKGVGGALVRHCVKAATEMGCRKVVLFCSEGNAPFYERLGFRRHEVGMRMDLEAEDV